MCPGGRAIGGSLWVGWLGMLLVGRVLGPPVQLLRLFVLIVLLCKTANEQVKRAFYLITNFRLNELCKKDNMGTDMEKGDKEEIVGKKRKDKKLGLREGKNSKKEKKEEEGRDKSFKQRKKRRRRSKNEQEGENEKETEEKRRRGKREKEGRKRGK